MVAFPEIMTQPIQVAIAILHRQGQFSCNCETTFHRPPGHWGLFGGHLEPGETPAVAVERELLEEISYAPPTLLEFGCYADDNVIRHVYHAPTVELNQLVLAEAGTWVY